MNHKATARAQRELLQRDAVRLAATAGIEVERSMIVPLLVARGRVYHDSDDTVAIEYLSPFGDYYVDGTTVLREMRSDQHFGTLFQRPMKKSASEAPAEANPFKPGSSWNLTRQCWLLKNEPVRAAALKAEAES